MGLHKAKSENNLKVGMLRSANTIVVLFLRVGLTWSLYLSTWYTESMGQLAQRTAIISLPYPGFVQKKKKKRKPMLGSDQMFQVFLFILWIIICMDFWYFVHFRFDLWYCRCVGVFMVYFLLSQFNWAVLGFRVNVFLNEAKHFIWKMYYFPTSYRSHWFN